MMPGYEASWKDRYPARREAARHTRLGTIYNFGQTGALEVAAEAREREYAARWTKRGAQFMLSYNDLATDANATAAAFVRARIRDTVHDPATAAAIGTKRICIDTGYFETFNRPNVTLVDLNEGTIQTVIPEDARTRSGLHTLDSLAFATGFNAMTGALSRVAITGRNGLSLREKWEAGRRTYLGLMTAGFPNLFLITGPGSPSVLSNMMASIEQHVE